MARGGRRQSTAAAVVPANSLQPRTMILDNGAHSIKAGFAPDANDTENDDTSAEVTAAATTSCRLIPNCIARSHRDKRTYIGAELDSCADFGELAIRRPVEKGFVVGWEAEKGVWEKTFGVGGAAAGDAVLPCEPAEVNLVLTEAPNAPIALQRNADEMVFEEFGFGSAVRVAAPLLNAYATSPFAGAPKREAGVPLDFLLVVDVGHSHTTITPLYQGRTLHPACRRLEIGGKMLTNALKDRLSRTVEVQKEDWIVQGIKEDVCYVSNAFDADLERAWKGGMRDPRPVDTSIVVDYVLPDYEEIKRGFARPHDPTISRKARALGLDGLRREHTVTIGNERFAIPELLFNPSDIGMQQDGIAGTILQSIHSLPSALWQPFLANIVVVGGTSKFPGFMQRLEAELRTRVSDDYLVRVAQASDPLKNTWIGGATLAQNRELLKSLVVTRAEYLEQGDVRTRRKFAGLLG